MTKKPDNPPVYPQARPSYLVDESLNVIQSIGEVPYRGGLSLLDYFAGRALLNHPFNLHERDLIAQHCYEQAAAMLAEREKRIAAEQPTE